MYDGSALNKKVIFFYGFYNFTCGGGVSVHSSGTF